MIFQDHIKIISPSNLSANRCQVQSSNFYRTPPDEVPIDPHFYLMTRCDLSLDMPWSLMHVTIRLTQAHNQESTAYIYIHMMVLGKIVEKITGMYNDSHLIHLILLVLGHDATLISAFPCPALLTWNWDKTRITWKSYSLVNFLTWRWGWVVKLGKAGVEGCETVESRKRECVLSHFYHDSQNFNICWCLRWWFFEVFPFWSLPPFRTFMLCCWRCHVEFATFFLFAQKKL